MNRRISNIEYRITNSIVLLTFSVWVGTSIMGVASLSAQGTTDNSEESDTTDVDSLAEVVRYSAERIVYFLDKEVVFLTGGAEAQHKTTRITADTLVYNTRTHNVIALGSPVLYAGDQMIKGERMEYNLETKKGIVYSGRTEIEKGIFEGEQIRLVEEGVLYINSGTFTTCDLEEPHTWFAANRLKVMSDHMVIARPVVFYIQGVPTFALPFWFFPIKKGRHSGILTPKFGIQSVDGAFVRNLSYYLVVNDYSDLTLTLDLFENRGIRSTVEGVYIVKPFFSGKIKTSYLNDISDPIKTTKRWRINADHEQDLGNKTRLIAQADFESDEKYDVELDEFRLVQLNRRLFSYLSVTKRWSIATLEGRLRQEQDLDKDTRDQTLPFLTFNLNQFHPFAFPLVLGYRTSFNNSRFVNDSTNTIKTVQTLTNSLPLSAPFPIIGHINLVPGARFNTTTIRDVKRDSIWTRGGSTTSLGLNTTLFGHSTFGIGSIQRFRHVFRPSLSYNRTQGFTFASGDFEKEEAKESISMSVGNEFQAQVKKENEKKTINLAFLSLSTSYNFNTKRLDDITSLLQIDPYRDLGITFRGTHNSDTLLKDFRLTTTLRLHGEIPLSEEEGSRKGPWNLTLHSNYTHSRIREDDIQLSGNMGFWLTQKWKINYTTRFDFETNRFVDHKFSLYRDLHEWEATFNFDKIGNNQRIDFKLSMKAIPEIRLGKGIFGLFLP